ncbi:Uncharacterised protein [uncultured archaeon]|nr:Uncharacterised protein [uncultured archaeon]
MDFDGALGLLRRVKSLGFREEETEIPLPDGEGRIADTLAPEAYGEFADSPADSLHQSLIFSGFPYTPRGSFAFSALVAEISKTAGAEPRKGEGARAARFGKSKNSTKWRETIDAAGAQKAAADAFAALPRKGGPGGASETQFAVNCNGKSVQCSMRLGAGWKLLFSMPFREGVWPVPGSRFIIAYSGGRGIYGEGGFNPALGNLVFAATPDAEYGWITERLDSAGLSEAAAEFADIYAQVHGAGGARQLREFFILAALLGGNAFAEAGGKRLHAPEFFANTEYMLAKAESEKAKGNMAEALFQLRTVSSLAALSLRASPLDGKMLAQKKFFDGVENAAPREFALDGKTTALLERLGADFEHPEKAKLKLAKGKQYSVQGGKISMDFGMLAMAMHNAGFFGGDAGAAPALWSQLRSKNAALFAASYAGGHTLSLLDEDTEITRGSDIFKVEQTGQKMVVRRAMALESGKAKEIKQHLARLIESAEMKSLDESERAGDFGIWGEAVYALARGEGGTVLALERSKRFY